MVTDSLQRRRGVILLTAVSTLAFGGIGFVVASAIQYSVFGQVTLVLLGVLGGMSRVVQPFIARWWHRASHSLARTTTTQSSPRHRAWIVGLLIAFSTLDLLVLLGAPDTRVVCLPVILLLLAILLGYLAWQTRGGQRVQHMLLPMAALMMALFGNALPLSPDHGILLGAINTQLSGIDAKLNALLQGQKQLADGQEDIKIALAQMQQELAILNAQRDAKDAAGIEPIEEGDPAPVREPLTEDERVEYERLKTLATTLAKSGNSEATLALYEAALRTGDAEQIKALKPKVARQLARNADKAFDVKMAEGNRLFYLRQYADAADTYLAAAHLKPDDETARSAFSDSVVNALWIADSSPQRKEVLLKELRTLTRAFPDDVYIRGNLAVALYNASNDRDSGSARTQSLLDELRVLAEAHPDEDSVRAPLAKGLLNAFVDSGSDSARAESLLRELRQLAEAHPGDAVVRDRFAWVLYNALYDSESGSKRAESLLSELRQLAEAHTDDTHVRGWLANGLFNAFYASESGSVRAEGLLDELRVLAAAYTYDMTVRDWFAKGLINAIADSDSDFVRTQSLLDELGGLARASPANPVIREQFAMGLFNAISDSGSNFTRAESVLVELRVLSEAHADDAAVRELLASGLFNALYESESGSERADDLLYELRKLAEAHIDDTAVQVLLAKAYGVSVHTATAGGDMQRAVAMAEALVPLADTVKSELDMNPLFKISIEAAIALAKEQGDKDARKRLNKVSQALFGE